MPNMSAPYLEWYNGTSIIEFFQYPNVVTSNMFWPLMLLVFGMIMFTSFRVFGTKTDEAFTTTTFLLIPVSILMAAAEFVDPSISIIPIILCIFSVITLYKKRGV